MNPKNIKKVLWVESGDGFLVLNDKIKEKICQLLKITDIEVATCNIDHVSQHANGDYDYFILTVDRDDLVQYVYETLGKPEGKILIVGTSRANRDECDWQASSPCGIHFLNFSKLRIPITRDGVIISLEDCTAPQTLCS